MKYYSFLSIVISLLYSFCCSGQKRLTIDEFKSRTITDFDGETGGKIISEQNFDLRLKKSAGIDKAMAKGSDGKFKDSILVKPEYEEEFVIYKGILINESTLPANREYEIQITRDDKTPVIITLIVEKPPVDGLQKACIPTLPTTSNDCAIIKNFKNKFGEDSNTYNKNTIVYIYDFNKNGLNKSLYKVTKKIEKSDSVITDPTTKKIQKIKKITEKLIVAPVNFNKETVTHRKDIRFKVVNINKYMYDVSISDSVVTYDSEPSALFSRIFLGDSTLLGSLMGTFTEIINKQSSSETTDDLKKIINSNIGCFIQKYNWLQNKMLEAYDQNSEFPCSYPIQYTDLANSLADIRAKTVKLQTFLDAKRKKAEISKQALNDCKTNRKTLENTNLTISKSEVEIKKLEDEIKKLSGDDKSKKETEFGAKKSELEKINTEKSKLEKSISESCGEIKEQQYETDNKNTEAELVEFIAINNLLANLPSDKELKKIITYLKNMVASNNSYSVDYIPLNGNMLDLKVGIKSKDSVFKYLSIPEYNNDPMHIQIPILLKPFISFSSGSFISLGSYLQNKTYAWQQGVGNNNTIDSSKYTLIESAYTSLPMGFAAFGNVEWKVTKSFGFGASAGVGLTIESTPRLAYLGGGSLFFGDLRQFAFTFGFAGMQVNKLNRNFQTVSDNQVVYTSTSKPTIDYYKDFKVGGFISLTYTPFKTVKNK